MVWHIFKKDWKLLWPFFLAVALVQFILAVIRLKLGLFGGNYILESLEDPAVFIALFATAFLIVAILHQDPIPGVRQDWLIRPVKRRDLLFAKLFFVFIVLQGSIILADTFQVLASGFSLRDSVAAAFDHNILFVLIVVLPALALAAVTSSMMEAVVGAVIGFFAGTAILVLYETLNTDARFSVLRTGERWIALSAMVAVCILAAACVLLIQFFRRWTPLARWALGISVLMYMLSLFAFPWKTAFALQTHFASNPGSARSIALSFDPALGRYRPPSGLSASDEQHLSYQAGETPAQIFLPLHISDLPDDSVLKADKSELTLIASSGQVVYRGNGDDLEVRAEGPGNGQQGTHLEVDFPSAKYLQLKAQPLRAELNYSLTLFRLGSAYAVPALGADQRMPAAGRCATQMNESGTAIEIRCEQAGKGPGCGTFFLENPSTGARNPVISACDPNYSPRFAWTSDDPIAHWGLNLRFRDPSGLMHYSVDGPQLPKSQVVLRLYEPEDHFTRQSVIPTISLKDWESK